MAAAAATAFVDHVQRTDNGGSCYSIGLVRRYSVEALAGRLRSGLGLPRHRDGGDGKMVVAGQLRTLQRVPSLTNYQIAINKSQFDSESNNMAQATHLLRARRQHSKQRVGASHTMHATAKHNDCNK